MTPGADRLRLLAAYDVQLRGVAEMQSAASWDRVGPLFRGLLAQAGTARAGFVSYESLAGYDVARLVRATLGHYAALPHLTSVEWKTRGHDDLPDLDGVLRSVGFVPEDVETVMVGQAAVLAAGPRERDLPHGVRVRRIDDAPDADEALAAATAVQAAAFGSSHDLAGAVARGGGNVEAWVVEIDGAPVSVGRLEVVPGTEFAGLWGGATLPQWRGRGLYRALTAARARSALARGVVLIQSDCTEMSRPILERSGLVAVTTTTPYLWTRPADP